MLAVFRKEIKYVIPTEEFSRLERLLDAVLERDGYGDRGTYTVRSQYYDSLADRDFHDNLDGLMEKRKIRVRIYSPEDTAAKLEYKCKSGSDGMKYSISISREEALLMERHQYGFLMNHTEELAGRLYVKMIRNVYRPKTIVQYDRTAFLYPVSDVRITFDHNMAGTAGAYGLFEKNPFLIPLMRPDTGVLEVKYNDFLPAPIKEIVSRVDSLADANSKYSQARFINV